MNSKKKKMLKRAIPLYIMVAPGFIYLLINNYIPMLGIVIAFKNLNFSKGILKSDWAGLSNFEYLFKAPDAFLITRNTILYNVAFIVVNTVVAIVIAIILSEIRSKMKVKIFQSCVLIPSLISIIIVSYLAYAFLSGRTGFINGSLAAAGKDTISFYTEPKYWPAILIFINCWKGAIFSRCIERPVHIFLSGQKFFLLRPLFLSFAITVFYSYFFTSTFLHVILIVTQFHAFFNAFRQRKNVFFDTASKTNVSLFTTQKLAVRW